MTSTCSTFNTELQFLVRRLFAVVFDLNVVGLYVRTRYEKLLVHI